MKRIIHNWAAMPVGLLLALLSIPTVAGQEVEADGIIQPRADRILRQMGEYLGTADEFRFQVEITYDSVRSTGQKILLGGRADASLQRPNRFHAYYEGDRRHSHAIFSNGTFTYFDVTKNLYSRMKIPADLDDALDMVFDSVGISAPAADFLYADPYLTLIENARSGYVVGRHPVGGTPCHHLAFTHDAIDWQIWIEDGPRPVPRRLVITYKDEFGEPQVTTTFVEWDFQPRLSSSHFEFDPPADSAEIEFLPSQ